VAGILIEEINLAVIAGRWPAAQWLQRMTSRHVNPTTQTSMRHAGSSSASDCC
jgi:hypothetical protein